MSTHAQDGTGVEVVHLAAHAQTRRPRQRCARCSVVLVDQGKPFPPGESVVALDKAVWATPDRPTCQVPQLRVHDLKGAR